jgi:hypothetical protein
MVNIPTKTLGPFCIYSDRPYYRSRAPSVIANNYVQTVLGEWEAGRLISDIVFRGGAGVDVLSIYYKPPPIGIPLIMYRVAIRVIGIKFDGHLFSMLNAVTTLGLRILAMYMPDNLWIVVSGINDLLVFVRSIARKLSIDECIP